MSVPDRGHGARQQADEELPLVAAAQEVALPGVGPALDPDEEVILADHLHLPAIELDAHELERVPACFLSAARRLAQTHEGILWLVVIVGGVRTVSPRAPERGDATAFAIFGSLGVALSQLAIWSRGA